jgi:hypothetical protein
MKDKKLRVLQFHTASYPRGHDNKEIYPIKSAGHRPVYPPRIGAMPPDIVGF